MDKIVKIDEKNDACEIARTCRFDALNAPKTICTCTTRSQTAMFATKYVAELRKHFNGSLARHVSKATCDITPVKHTTYVDQ